jgi:glycine C-acetyltransferase
MDLFQKVLDNPGPLGAYAEEAHGYLTYPKLEGPISNRMYFRGREKIVWSVNNYLGLANHPEVRETDRKAAEENGLASPMGARMMTGNTDHHDELEQGLSEFVQKEDTFILNYGYQGVMSVVDAVVDRKDVIIYDSQSHACIIDGIRMHNGKHMSFQHNDIQHLEKQLKKASSILNPDEGGILVVTEGVFGMSGDEGLVKEVAQLKEAYNFRLLVDDAHGFGTMGPNGSGVPMKQGVQQDVDLYFSTFAKSMASIGAFVSGNEDIIYFLRYNMRSQIFAKSLPLPIVIGNKKRLELLRGSSEYQEQLWHNVENLQQGLRQAGFNIGNTTTPVTPVFLNGTVQEATNLTTDLRENYDIFCSVVIYPVVPRGTILLRLIPTAVHTDEDVELTIQAFKDVAKNLQDKKYDKSKLIEIAEI